MARMTINSPASSRSAMKSFKFCTLLVFLCYLLQLQVFVGAHPHHSDSATSTGSCPYAGQHGHYNAPSARVRKAAPDFKAKAVLDDAFLDITFSDYQKRGEWGVLLFYPFDYTFVCPTELVSYSNAKDQFQALNTHVLAISTDSHHTHLSWTRAKREDGGVGRLKIPLVADTAHTISRAYGVLVTDPEDDMYGAALRGLFIVDPSGRIRMMQINDDSVGRNVEETLRLVKAFQYSDAHQGEACPASWQPGGDTIRTNPWESKEYFKAHSQD